MRLTAAYIPLAKSRKWRHIGSLEIRFADYQRGYFERQGRTFMRGFERLSSVGVGDYLGDLIARLVFDQREALHPGWIAEWSEVASTAAVHGARDTAADLGIADAVASLRAARLPEGLSFDIAQRPEVADYINNQAAIRVAGIDETTIAELRAILSRAITDGESYSSLAREIKNRWDEYASPASQGHLSTRAELIAVTETADAYGQGRLALGHELAGYGMTLTKEFLTADDERVCDDCQGNADEGPIPFDQAFSSGDDMPPIHPGDRCDALVQTA